MKKTITSKDIDYSFRAHPVSGNLILKTGRDSIKQSVKTLLLINFFEKLFSPVSANLRGKLFDNFDIVSESDSISKIKEILSLYEPRIVVDSVTINYGVTRETIEEVFVDTRDQEVVVNVTYTIIGEETQEAIALTVTRTR